MNKVTITVSGAVGSGKSALCGEIEILCKALGLQVDWIGGREEKNLTHADWTEALEMYKPSVTLVEQIERKAAPADAQAVEGVRAWETDDGRVISDEQKQQALRDGGASSSSVRPYAHALGRIAPAQAAKPVAIPQPVLDALRFYANGHHFSIDDDHQQFDTVSGEPQNWLCSERDDDCTMIEDGSIAKAALRGQPLGFEEPVSAIEGEAFAAPPPPAPASAQPAELAGECYIVIGHGETDIPEAKIVTRRDDLLDAVLGMMYGSVSDAPADLRADYAAMLADEDEWAADTWSVSFEIGGIVVWHVGLHPIVAPASAPVGLTDALRQAREELSQVEWENDPPARVTALFSKIDALLAAHPGQPEPRDEVTSVQWWLAELDQYGNPKLSDGAHSERAGADKAMYLIKNLGLDNKGKRWAVARVELSEPRPSADDVNQDAVSACRAMVDAARAGGA
ncbi:TPA: hypothetical protein U2T46_000891 [Burkholderia cenocepacia]|nr:hypothetical protein [Burkholderia cenocepacia]